MGQESNDLTQLLAVRRTLANVYKTQVVDEIMDNGNLTVLNNAILNINQVIRFLEAHQPKG